MNIILSIISDAVIAVCLVVALCAAINVIYILRDNLLRMKGVDDCKKWKRMYEYTCYTFELLISAAIMVVVIATMAFLITLMV
jgi:hypothetical protein